MKRNVAILILTILLVILATIEEIGVHKLSSKMNEYSKNLEVAVAANEDNLNCAAVEQNFGVLKSFWEDEKIKVCYFTNYDKIRMVDESIVKLDYGIKNNEKSLVVENLGLLLQFGEFLHFTNGFNLNNLF